MGGDDSSSSGEKGKAFSGEILILTMIAMVTRFLRTSGEDMNM